jgi:hypothetical protein
MTTFTHGQFVLDRIHKQFQDDWAKRNNVKVLSCSAPPSPFKEQYAKDHGARIVPSCFDGRVGQVMVVKDLEETGKC